MKNRTFQTFLFLMAFIAFDLSLYAQQVDYKNLKKGDVLPIGDSLVEIRQVYSEEATMEIQSFLFRNLNGDFQRMVFKNGNSIKEFDKWSMVIADHGIISQKFSNGDICIYNQNWELTAKFNERDYQTQEYSIEYDPGPPRILSDKYLLFYNKNRIQILNTEGKPVLIRDSILAQAIHGIDHFKKWSIENGKCLLQFTNDEHNQGHLILIDLNILKIEKELKTTGLFKDKSTYIYDTYYSTQTGFLYIRGERVTVTDFQKSFITYLPDNKFYPLKYKPFENGNHIVLFSDGLHKFNIKTGELIKQVSIKELLGKEAIKYGFANQVVSSKNGFFILLIQINNSGINNQKFSMLQVDQDLNPIIIHDLSHLKLSLDNIKWEDIVDTLSNDK